MNKDYYKILGVGQSATTDEIKKAYRQLAKKFHPDAHPNDKRAEERFKEISEAYAVLADESKRRQYDQMRKLGAGNFSGFDFRQYRNSGGRSSASYNFDDYNIGDIFSQFFNNGVRSTPFSDVEENLDLHAEIEVPFNLALHGGRQMLTIDGERKRKLAVTIPAGIEDGKKIRLSGQGRMSSIQQRTGDLIVTVRVQPHPHFRREGLDVYYDAGLNVAQATLGSTIQVPTVYGSTVEIKIPAGTQNEKLFKLKGLGVKSSQEVGDYYVRMQVQIPASLSERAKELLKKFAAEAGLHF
jgi:DnaJ-class molecular chaperone